jgi:hypothetical protein
MPLKNRRHIIKRIADIYCLIAGTLIILCLFILLCIFVTELDIRNIEKQTEWQKLEYYKTLNKIYNSF